MLEETKHHTSRRAACSFGEQLRRDAARCGDIRAISFAAVLAAMSLILGKFLQIPNPFQDFIRISFENLPLILSGITMGPFIGAMTGVVADLVGCFLYGYSINPIVTLGALAVGFFSGAVSHYVWRRRGIVQIVLSVVAAHLVGSVFIKSFGLAAWYLGKYQIGFWELVLWRFVTYILTAIAESAVLSVLLQNRAFMAQLDRSLDAARHKGHRNEKKESMTYEEALAYIHSVTWKGSRPGLSRITELLSRLGDPQNDLRFIHIAGTNGKGSTSAMTEAILRAAGYRTGLFVSPFIKHFNERICVSGEMISNEELAAATAAVRPVADSMEDAPTEFELITAIGLVYFKKMNCDVVVLETGMGGRLDSTNIIKDPILTIITGIALDHMAFLGDSIEKIAAEKAGIAKSGTPMLFGGEDAAARAVIEAHCKEVGAPFHVVADTLATDVVCTADGTSITYGEFSNVKIPLVGIYQAKNLATVLASVPLLRERGLNISDEALRAGLRGVTWRGRFEKLATDPLVIFDGAHNEEGMTAAVESVRRFLGGRVLVLTGMLADKAYGKMVDLLSTVAVESFTVTPDNPRALSSNDLAAEFAARGIPNHAFADIASGVTAAVTAAKKEGLPLMILGSLYLYGDVSDAVEKALSDR